MFAPFKLLTPEDLAIAESYLGSLDREPDLILAPDGEPYMYRWHVVRDKALAGVYFHMQVRDDPERPLHDHPWDNMSVILSGGYSEILQGNPPHGRYLSIMRQKGDVVFRRATEAHRLMLPDRGYTLTQFSTGPKVREWGFWYGERWVPYTEVTELLADGRSVHIHSGDMR